MRIFRPIHFARIRLCQIVHDWQAFQLTFRECRISKVFDFNKQSLLFSSEKVVHFSFQLCERRSKQSSLRFERVSKLSDCKFAVQNANGLCVRIVKHFVFSGEGRGESTHQFRHFFKRGSDEIMRLIRRDWKGSHSSSPRIENCSFWNIARACVFQFAERTQQTSAKSILFL
jgi:hypothetical protein